MKYLKNENGLSLVEVLVSFVILSIVLISFVQVFVQTNKTSTYNNEKLVLINLANAELERLKLTGFDGSKTTLTYDSEFQTHYKVKVDKEACTDCMDLKLVNVTVTVTSGKTNSKAAVEGFVRNVK